MIYPYASADEVRRFLFENNPNNPTIFSRCYIYRSEKIIGLTNKRGSTTASQAMEPHNIIRRWCLRKRLYQIRTEEDLIRNTYQVIGNTGNTDETFIQCGYYIFLDS